MFRNSVLVSFSLHFWFPLCINLLHFCCYLLFIRYFHTQTTFYTTHNVMSEFHIRWNQSSNISIYTHWILLLIQLVAVGTLGTHKSKSKEEDQTWKKNIWLDCQCAMAANKAAVSVLTLNGRRQIVKVSPNTSLLQVLVSKTYQRTYSLRCLP